MRSLWLGHLGVADYFQGYLTKSRLQQIQPEGYLTPRLACSGMGLGII